MIFFLISFVLPLVIYFALPEFLKRAFGKPPASRWPLAVGGLVFFWSWYLPSPLIQGARTQFMTHLVGGGVFSGFVWLYVIRHLRIALPAWLELFSLFALVSALGAANELFELAITQANFVDMSPIDTWWDIFANTLGTLIFWTGYRAARWTAHRGK